MTNRQSFIRRDRARPVPTFRKAFFSSAFPFLVAILVNLFSIATASAVMPPRYYDEAARASEITAIAVIDKVEVLEQTKRSTQKLVTFTLEQTFGKDVPKIFTGTCYSIDHSWQDPGVGGTIYYYPEKGSRVFVTISKNGGSITSFTTITPDLEQELSQNGLKNIFFGMGRASIRKKPELSGESWFTFHVDDKPVGYLHIRQMKESGDEIEAVHELLMGELDGDRTLYSITTRSRKDGTMTPLQMTIETTEITEEGTSIKETRTVNFRTIAEKDAAEGILVTENFDTIDVGIPSATATDFLLFSLVEKMPFETDGNLRFNLIESLELHLKKNVTIHYEGRDVNKGKQHKFLETGPAQATYWLNDSHQLVEVQWDRDKRFLRSSEAEAMTVLQ